MKTIGFLFLIILASCSTSEIHKVSRVLRNKQNDRVGQFKTKTFYQVRKQLLRKYPEILRHDFDTIFLIEKYQVEEGRFYGTIWNRRDTVNYTVAGNDAQITKSGYFTTNVIRLVSQWDTVMIRQAEFKYPNTEREVHASRITIKGQKYNVKTMEMRDLLFD